MKLTPDRLKQIVQQAHRGSLPQGKILTFQYILDLAEQTARSQGFVDYSDYGTELLTEVLNGTWKIEKVGFRLYPIRTTLKQSRWRSESKPARFYPPNK